MPGLTGAHFVAAKIQPWPADAGSSSSAVPGYAAHVPIQFRDAGGRYARPVNCVLDTGATHSVVSEVTARMLGFELSGEAADRVQTADGEAAGWHRQRYIRFPGLPGLQFRVWFLILVGDHPPRPLLGLRDIYLNFDLATRGGDVVFLLKDGHTGESFAPPA